MLLGGGRGAGGSVLGFGADRVGSSTTTRHLFPGYAEALAEISLSGVASPRPGSVRNLNVVHNDIGVGATLILYTLLVNGAPTSLSVGLAASAAAGANTTALIPVLAGDILAIRITKAAAIGASPRNVQASVEIS